MGAVNVCNIQLLTLLFLIGCCGTSIGIGIINIKHVWYFTAGDCGRSDSMRSSKIILLIPHTWGVDQAVGSGYDRYRGNIVLSIRAHYHLVCSQSETDTTQQITSCRFRECALSELSGLIHQEFFISCQTFFFHWCNMYRLQKKVCKRSGGLTEQLCRRCKCNFSMKMKKKGNQRNRWLT